MSKNTKVRTGAAAKIPTQGGDRSFIPDNSVSTNKLQDLAVTKGKLALSALFSDINSINGADYTVLDSDGYETLLVTTGALDRTVTLPTVSDNTGRRLTIKKIDSGVGNVIIDGEGAEEIDGQVTCTMYTQYDFLTIECDGTGWNIIDFGIQNRIQTKVLSASVTSDGVMSDLTFSNLETGKWYEVSGKIVLQVDSGASDTSVSVNAVHDSNTIDTYAFTLQESTDSAADQVRQSTSFKFKATATSLTFEASSASANSIVNGNNTRTLTYVQIEERNDLMFSSETTDF